MRFFEIEIFAIPSGFKEEGLFTKVNELFPKDYAVKRNLDGERSFFKSGSFSVFFTPDVYILDYRFDVVTEAKFRETVTHISIAIQRGYRLRDTISIFTELRKKFNIIAAREQENIVKTLPGQLAEFNAVVEGNIEAEPDQLHINTNIIDTPLRAIVSYDTEEQLNLLLSNPNRQKFSGYNPIIFLPRQEASAIYSTIKDFYKALPMNEEEFTAVQSYEVVFPDGHKQTIKGRNDALDYTCRIPHHQPLPFKGRLCDHIADWSVTQSEDRSQFLIGMRPVPEVKIFQIICYDVQGKKIKTPSALSFNTGQFNPAKSTLTLTGTEISAQLLCTPQSNTLCIVKYQKAESSITLWIKTLQCYNLSKVINEMARITNENVTVTLYERKLPVAQLTSLHPAHYSSSSPVNMAFEISETTKYNAYRNGKFNEDCTPFFDARKLKKKSTGCIRFSIRNQRILQALPIQPVVCRYRSANQQDFQEVTFDDQGKLTIEELPTGTLEYIIEAKGYKSMVDDCVLAANIVKEIPIKLKPSSLNIAKRIFISTGGYAAMLVIGMGIGGLGVKHFNCPKGNNNGVDSTHHDSVDYDSILYNTDSVEIYKDSISNLKDSLKQIRIIISIANTLSSETNPQIADKLYERVNLTIKLMGSEYENKDIMAFKNKYKDRTSYEENILNSANNALCTIIQSNDGNSGFYKKEILIPGTKMGNAYKNLLQCHKDALKEITKDPVSINAFVTCSGINGAKTIKEAIKKVKESQG